MQDEAIILAGGLGTRLRSVVADVPKCMAPVAGKPFLTYLMAYLQKQGINKCIFSLGYKSESVISFIDSNYRELSTEYVIEDEPLGTGGAVKLALTKATARDVFIINGDTFFNADLQTMKAVHGQQNADCTLCLKRMENFDRYGVVETEGNGKVTSFKEKQFYTEGTINGGIYLVNVNSFKQLPFPTKFSFEKDYLEQYLDPQRIFAHIDNGYFIDIGIPEDYTRAQTELLLFI
jgi:D-glycero-alpha-D-manno-heptose 1-phosphate guanylyltransferase